jgi:ABC-type amino acid transport system permease subunit
MRVLNTLHLTAVAIDRTTVLGVTIGPLSLSDIKIARTITRLHVECMRNLAKLLEVLTVSVVLVPQSPIARDWLIQNHEP